MKDAADLDAVARSPVVDDVGTDRKLEAFDGTQPRRQSHPGEIGKNAETRMDVARVAIRLCLTEYVESLAVDTLEIGSR